MLTQLASLSRRTSKSQLPSKTLSVQEAFEKLVDEFGDQVCVQKAFAMLGQLAQITPDVSALTTRAFNSLALGLQTAADGAAQDCCAPEAASEEGRSQTSQGRPWLPLDRVCRQQKSQRWVRKIICERQSLPAAGRGTL